MGALDVCMASIWFETGCILAHLWPIIIHMKTTTRKQTEAYRPRLNIPRTDDSVVRWFEAQENASASVRMAVREAIERHGYADITCLPVDKAPRMGRPPKVRESVASPSSPSSRAPERAESERREESEPDEGLFVTDVLGSSDDDDEDAGSVLDSMR